MVAVLAGMMVSLTVGGVASALEYTSNPVPVSFTFNSVLTLSTDGNIAISNLTPGNKGISSNDYTVTVSTNSVAGYTLSATVGCASGTGCFNSKILGDGNNNDFAMVETTTTLTPGKWGVSLDSTATENSNFKTLPLYSDTAETINQTTDASGTAASGYQGTQDTTFRVGAYAAESQVAGTYTNVINFTAVANMTANCGNYTAEYCMQDISSWKSGLTTSQQIQAMDARDGKLYYVAKLADGNVWMTQNLDHDIVTTAGYYTYANTDIGHGATPNTNATWTAQTATYATNDTTWNDTVDEPESYNPGDLCWNGTIRSDNNGTITTDTVACGNDKHYHIGNYYNWTAAVAMNDSSSYTTDQQDTDQSICPAGWRLPTLSGNKSYDNLVTTLSLTAGTSGNVQSAPAYFVYGGYWGGESNRVGGGGVYWSSVVYDVDYSHGFLFIGGGYMYPQGIDYRDRGNSVRCVAR